MIFDPKQRQFPSATHQSVWHAALFLAPFYKVMPAEFKGGKAGDLAEGEANLHRFMNDLFSDLYQNPEAYFLPAGDYDEFMKGKEGKELSRKEETRESYLRNRFQRSIQFHQKLLFEIGTQSKLLPGCDSLSLDESVLSGMMLKHNLRILRGEERKRASALERLGLKIKSINTRFRVTNDDYPKMLLALTTLCKSVSPRYGLTHFLRCDFRGLNRSHKPDFRDAVSVLPDSFEKGVEAMHVFMQTLKCKTTVEPLKNTTLYSKWKLTYQLKNKAVYSFHADTGHLEVFAYFNHPDYVSRMGYLLKNESNSLYDWFYERIPMRSCACRNNRRVDIGGREKRICGLMNRMEVVNPDREDFIKLKRIITIFLTKPT
jgi:hypothetical protein